MPNLEWRFSRLITAGLLRWIGSLEADILALSAKPDTTKALSALRLVTLYHPTHFPEPTDDSYLYIVLLGPPSMRWEAGRLVQATLALVIMKGTQVQTTDGVASVVADAPLLGDIVELLLTEIAQFGHATYGGATASRPDGVTETLPFERLCRLQSANVTYHPSLEDINGGEIHAVAYRMELTLDLVRC